MLSAAPPAGRRARAWHLVGDVSASLLTAAGGCVVAFLLGGLGFVIHGDPNARSLPWLLGCALGAALGAVAVRAQLAPAALDTVAPVC